MQTKYILSGGAAHIVDPRNDQFFSEILKDTAEEVNILLVLFSKEGEKIVSNSEEDIVQFNRAKSNKKLNFKIAEKNSFLEQISWADVVFLHGGAPQIQLPIFLTFDKTQLEQAFNGKIIAGDSAGTYFLAKYVYSIFKEQVYDGLGILPIKLICHYSAGSEKDLENLEEDLELVCLKEYEHRIFCV